MNGAKPLHTGNANVDYLSQTILGTPVSSEDQTVPVTGTSAQSTSLTAGSLYVVVPGVDMHIAVGSNPVATTGKRRLLADKEYQFFVQEALKFAFIKGSGEGDGTVWISRSAHPGESLL